MHGARPWPMVAAALALVGVAGCHDWEGLTVAVPMRGIMTSSATSGTTLRVDLPAALEGDTRLIALTARSSVPTPMGWSSLGGVLNDNGGGNGFSSRIMAHAWAAGDSDELTFVQSSSGQQGTITFSYGTSVDALRLVSAVALGPSASFDVRRLAEARRGDRLLVLPSNCFGSGTSWDAPGLDRLADNGLIAAFEHVAASDGPVGPFTITNSGKEYANVMVLLIEARP